MALDTITVLAKIFIMSDPSNLFGFDVTKLLTGCCGEINENDKDFKSILKSLHQMPQNKDGVLGTSASSSAAITSINKVKKPAKTHALSCKRRLSPQGYPDYSRIPDEAVPCKIGSAQQENFPAKLFKILKE